MQIIIVRNNSDKVIASLIVDALKDRGYSTKTLQPNEYLKEEPNYPAHTPKVFIGGIRENSITEKFMGLLEFNKFLDLFIGRGFCKLAIYSNDELNITSINKFIKDKLDNYLEQLKPEFSNHKQVYVISSEDDGFASRYLIDEFAKLGLFAYYWNTSYYKQKSEDIRSDSYQITIGDEKYNQITKKFQDTFPLDTVYDHPFFKIQNYYNIFTVYGEGPGKSIPGQMASYMAVKLFINQYFPKYINPDEVKIKDDSKVSDSQMNIELIPHVFTSSGKSENQVKVNDKVYTLSNKNFDFLYYIAWLSQNNQRLTKGVDISVSDFENCGIKNERFDWATDADAQARVKSNVNIKLDKKELIYFKNGEFSIHPDIDKDNIILHKYK